MKLTPIQASLKKNEGFACKKLLDKRKKSKPKNKMGDLARTADVKRTSSKGDSTDCSYKLYENTETINDTISSYRIDKLPERYNENDEIISEREHRCYGSLKPKLSQSVLAHHCLYLLI